MKTKDNEETVEKWDTKENVLQRSKEIIADTEKQTMQHNSNCVNKIHHDMEHSQIMHNGIKDDNAACTWINRQNVT